MTDQPRAPEIKDTPVDRTAMGLMLERYPDLQIDALTAGIGALNAAWLTIAKDLAQCPAEAFNAFDAGFVQQEKDLARAIRTPRKGQLDLDADGRSGDATPLEAVRRIIGLMSNLTEWRHMTWEANEIRAGRDPHRVYVPEPNGKR